MEVLRAAGRAAPSVRPGLLGSQTTIQARSSSGVCRQSDRHQVQTGPVRPPPPPPHTHTQRGAPPQAAHERPSAAHWHTHRLGAPGHSVVPHHGRHAMLGAHFVVVCQHIGLVLGDWRQRRPGGAGQQRPAGEGQRMRRQAKQGRARFPSAFGTASVLPDVCLTPRSEAQMQVTHVSCRQS